MPQSAALLNDWVDLLVYSSIIPIVLFIAFYIRKSPWFANDLGVAQLSSKISQLIVFLVIGLSLLLGKDYPGREWVRFAGYLPVVLMMWFDFINLRRYQMAFPVDKTNLKRPTLWTMVKRYFRPPV